METIKNNLVFTILLLLMLGGFAGFLVYKSAKAPPSARETTIEGVKEVDITDKEHTNEPVSYPNSPPIGGNHSPVWAGCDQKVYPQPLRNENAVHSLEHGAVWITYQPDLDQSAVQKLSAKVAASGATFMSPYPQQPSPITLSAWGTQLELSSADDPRIDQFLTKYRKGPKAPEPGATCTAP